MNKYNYENCRYIGPNVRVSCRKYVISSGNQYICDVIMKLQTLIEQITNKKAMLNKLVDKNLLLLNSLYANGGYELRIVGGAVRDILTNKKPKDIDLASNATPTESLKLLKTNDIKVIETGLQHGTITAHIGDDDYEITTLRIDKETDGRHAEVEFTKDWKEDAARRDLTFNAMSMDFNGNLYDYFDGHEDLKNGRARFVGDANQRVQEDYLRILRYFRFQGKTDSVIFDSDTISKIKNNAGGLDNISGERIWSEFGKILSGNNLLDIIKLMSKTTVLDHIGLSNIDMNELMAVKKFTNDPILLMASTLDTVDNLDTLREKWKFTTQEYNMMKFIIRTRDVDVNFSEAKKLNILNRVDKKLIVGILNYQGKTSLASKFDNWTPPIFPVNGDDLKSNGVQPGPELGKILNTLKVKWVDSGYTLDKPTLINMI